MVNSSRKLYSHPLILRGTVAARERDPLKARTQPARPASPVDPPSLPPGNRAPCSSICPSTNSSARSICDKPVPLNLRNPAVAPGISETHASLAPARFADADHAGADLFAHLVDADLKEQARDYGQSKMREEF